MDQSEKARQFHALHVKGAPLVLYNIWDAGSAAAIVKAGAPAVATGSWSVAAALGFQDGEAVPLDVVEQVSRQIAGAVDVPVSIDFEGGYAAAPDAVAQNVARIVGAGAIGINFEDQVVGGEGLYGVSDQCARIAAIRSRAETLGVPLFINARTDLFLKQPDRSRHSDILDEAKQRASAYQDAGASGFFAPALVDETLIADLCAAASLPVNIMMMGGAPTIERLGALGVARVSHGPGPYRQAMAMLTEDAGNVYAAASA
ncbi:MAG: isocitrate lyase/phosphoenolpyruvate mutase family protein [Pseudomonadota bacterium]